MDRDAIAEQLRHLGAPESIQAQWSSAPEEDTLEVLECNLPALEVYQLCRWNIVAGMGGAHYDGISAQEIRSALIIKRMSHRHWEDVLWRVQYLAKVAQPLLNARSK